MYNGKQRHWNAVTISIPDDQLQQIDSLRHDITRSRYIQRIIEDHMKLIEMELSD